MNQKNNKSQQEIKERAVTNPSAYMKKILIILVVTLIVIGFFLWQKFEQPIRISMALPKAKDFVRTETAKISLPTTNVSREEMDNGCKTHKVKASIYTACEYKISSFYLGSNNVNEINEIDKTLRSAGWQIERSHISGDDWLYEWLFTRKGEYSLDQEENKLTNAEKNKIVMEKSPTDPNIQYSKKDGSLSLRVLNKSTLENLKKRFRNEYDDELSDQQIETLLKVLSSSKSHYLYGFEIRKSYYFSYN